MDEKKTDWKFADSFEVTHYECGAVAGGEVRLLVDLAIRDHKLMPTGLVYRKGEVWKVLCGSTQDPKVVFLESPDGERHTWDDDASFWEQFEILPTSVN